MSENRRVVVTGIGAITPLGNNVADTWEGMKNGKKGIAPITLFDTEKFKAKLGAEVKGFDPKEYMEINETLRTDRYTQFAVAAAQQAVDESGIEGKVEPERFAVQFGTGIGGIGTFETEHTKLIEKGPRRVSPLFVPMMIANMAAGTIAIRHDCRGSAQPSVTACASGSNAIGEAMRMIRHGYADAVITGGAEAAVIPSAVAGFINCQALSVSENPDEASLPFDKRRGGFVIGEGAVALILEEYEHAKARGAKIYGEVCGYGSTCDAHHITAPHPEARGGAQAMMDAMKEANYTDNDVVYVNAHGTGTPIKNALYRSYTDTDLGQPVSLSDLPQYADLQDAYTFREPVGSVGVVFLRTPMENCVDGSADAVSVYAAAVGLIHGINRNEAQLNGEFERSKSRLIVSADMFKKDKQGRTRLVDDVFTALDDDPESTGITIFAPAIREQSFLARKQDYLRTAENIIGLKRGLLSEVEAVERTAKEITSSEGDYSLTITDFQQMWEKAVYETLRLCGTLGKLYSVPGAHDIAEDQVVISWGNGVLFDEEKTRQRMLSETQAGLLQPERYLGFTYKLPCDTPSQRARIRKDYMPGVEGEPEEDV